MKNTLLMTLRWGQNTKKYTFSLLTFILILSGTFTPARASGIQTNGSQDEETFPIGIFWPPTWANTNDEQYDYIKEAKIDYIQNVSSTDLNTVEKNLAMLDLAEARGLKVQVSDDRVKNILNLTDEELAAMVNDYKDHPATYGYYVKDEPTPSELEDYAIAYNRVLQLDPERIPSLNLLPKTWAIPNYKGYVEGWINAVGASNLKLLSFDFYPFPDSPSGGVSEDYYVTLEHIKEAGLKYNLKTAGYLQSFGIPGVYRRPNENEMRYNVYSLLSYGVKNPIWFTWWTPESQNETFVDGIIDKEGNKTDFYEPVKQLNADMKSLGRTLIHLDAKYVYHQGVAQKGTKSVPEDFIWLPQNSSDDLILTYFINPNNGKSYVMVVNKSLSNSKALTFQLDPTLNAADIKEVSAVSGGSEVIPTINASENTISADFLPGEGKLYALPAGYTYTETKDQSNVIPNGGFENGLWPDHKGATLDTAIRRKGQSVKLTAAGEQAYVESSVAKIGRQNSHSFNIWLKTDNISTGNGVKVELMQVDANGFDVGLYPGSVTVGGTAGWMKYEIPNLQTSASGIRVIVKTLPGVEGTVWADEAVLTDTSAIEILTDELLSFDHIYEKSANFWFDGSNITVADGDESRLMRTSDTDEYIVYNKPSISKFEAKLYTGNTDYVDFYVSPDNVTWSPVTVKDVNKKNTSNEWFTVTKSSDGIPSGMNYLKVVFKANNEYNWYPQLGQMKITYGSDAAEGNSLIDNSGFENGLWNMQRGAILDTSVKHYGNASAKLEAGPTGNWMSSAIATPDPAQRHDLSVWLKTDGITDPKGVRIELMQVDANGNDIGLITEPNGRIEIGGTQEWTQFNLEGVRIAAPGVRVIVRTTSGISGTVWMDDVNLTDIPAYGTLRDELSSFDAVLEKSNNIWLDSTNPDIAEGDESRLTRTADTDEYLVYHKEAITKFSAQLYTGSTDYVDFYVSPNNADWTQVEVNTSDKVETNRGWFKLTKSSVSVPPGMNYLKMVVRGNNEFSWYPQIGSISITSGYGDDVLAPPVSLLKNSGFEAGIWPNHQGATLDTEVKHSGNAGVKITADADGSFIGSYATRVDPLQAYALSLWLKTDGISDLDGVQVEIDELDYEGNRIGLYVPDMGQLTTGGTKDWEIYGVPVIDHLNPATASLQVTVRTKAGTSGTVYVDDLKLIQTDDQLVNHAPTATASITGTAQVGATLTGTHTFSDPDVGDTEGVSTYRWLISSTLAGTYTAIQGATSTAYTPFSGDQGKYIKVEVTPVDNHGLAGNPSISSATTAVAAASVGPVNNNNGNGGGSVTPIPESKAIQNVTEEQLKSSQGNVVLGSGITSLSLPINAAGVLQNALTIQSGQASVTIPSELLKALREQASKELMDAKRIIVKLERIQLSSDTDNTELKAGESGYVLELYAENERGTQTRLSSFVKPVRVVLPYDPAHNAELIGIYYYNETKRDWEYVGGIVDSAKGLISVELSHFSKYAVMEFNKSFTDLPSGHWAERAIKALAAKHVVSGADGESFKPDGLTTRAEFTAMLVRSFGLTVSKAGVPFKDIASNSWYSDAVRAAYEAGIIQGVAADRFDPNAQITREQMATLIVRAADYAKRELIVGNPGLSGYHDSDKVSGWATKAVDQAIQAGLMKGKKAGMFSPSDKVTRAETAQAIWNLLQ
ncbi:S-layer homology domain-containing protein [Cohnella sp. WQ 127256]|uniref:S-layer homology domain-containing protein n=1 Tax=Cohnella sp. WQ 127256 TaxID=2938790 RepID=UPI0021177291|nr:S-layer homology domain-containing protein [Cohnella sp. WQ 127256]